MPSTGPQAPASVTNLGGSNPWTNLSNMLTSNGVYASVEVDGIGANLSDVKWNSFGVPTDATITGVKVGYLSYVDPFVGFSNFYYTMLRNNSVDIGTLTGMSQLPAGAPAYRYIGGETNLLGAALTPAIANGGLFGIKVQTVTVDGCIFYWDFVDMEIFYTLPGVVIPRRRSEGKWGIVS